MAYKEWIINKSTSGGKNLVEKLLAARGIQSEKDIQEFLNPLSMDLTSPNVFVDMQKATERIISAITDNEKIVIYGDFDADGVTSTSVLHKTLKFLGANVNYFIPDREKDGHGMNTKALVALMTAEKPKLIITVDCASSDVKEVAFIKSFHIDVIITDHHETPEVLPDAYAIINPKAPNALDESLSARQIQSLTSLAGCGIAFKLAQSLLMHYDKTSFVSEILPFVAVGTVADVVPLVGENRYFVTKGLEYISKGRHYGLKRLLESAGYSVENGLTAETIAFGVAPRINASGRLDTVESAIKLLISENKQEIEMAIVTLNELNKVRQTLCQEVFAQADEMLKKERNKQPAIVLFNSQWQVGIIGIVASKLVEKYYKPTFLMTYSEGQIKCSARSVEGIHLYEVISSIGTILDGFGGHSMAAGLSFTPEKTPFKSVKEQLNRAVLEASSGKEIKPFINIDLELNASDISVDLVEQISSMEPFGASNPQPVFALKNCKLVQKKLMGENKNHLRLSVQNSGQEFTCIRWQDGDIALSAGDELDIAFHPQINVFNGNTSVQLIIDDIHSPNLKEVAPEDATLKVYDHRKKNGIFQQVNDYVKTSKLNIKIFAENRLICEQLSKYPDLCSREIRRENLEGCDVLMFFDYPADKETFDEIVRSTSPEAIHFMNYEIKYYDDKDFIKMFAGMLKFACNNNNGKVDLIRCASFLGKSVRLVKMLLEILEKYSVLKIISKNESFYTISLVELDKILSILNTSDYEEVMNVMEECEFFQKSLLEDDISEIYDMCRLLV